MSVFLAKGTRDFLPAQMRNRQWVIDRLREVFVRFGFEPLETPAFERIETLLGKGGEEGDRLIYRILKRGKAGARGEADLALRYDLTVPLARVVAMNPQLRLPFKRYQIQPVWRADRPQKGRFREFWQCDVDTVGTDSPVADAECLAVVTAGLEALGFTEYTVRLNDRRILTSLVVAAGAVDRGMDVLVAIDKLDKIGVAGVSEELRRKGLTDEHIARLWDNLRVPDDNPGALAALEEKLDARGAEGVGTLRDVLAAADKLGVPVSRVRIDPTLARGLDYYTGPVFEAEVVEPKVGSICGGGRYDHLIGMFSGRDIPAVGVSLGLERIAAVMEAHGMLPSTRAPAAVLVTVFDHHTRTQSLEATAALRAAGIATDLYLGEGRLKRQLKHANARGYPWLVVIGPDEAAAGAVSLRDLATGEQETLSIEGAIRKLAAPPRPKG
jgi:histidyl-tRNA synthetase